MVYNPNSSLHSSVDSVNGSWSYTYDDFARLTTAVGGQSYTFDYDRSGNRWHQNASPQYTFNSNNRISTGGYGYDAAGNMTNDTFHSYSFDAEERMTGVDNQNTATYNYDALSRRVQQTRSAPSASYTYLYDLAGRRVTDLYNHDWRRTEVYAGGERLGLYMGTTLYFTHTDWLGTERKRTDVNGNEVVHITGLPFGDGQAYSAWDPSQDYFTGQQYDDESNLDHFWFRQYASTQGRWLTPDPAGLAAADPSNPQSLNRYAYVMNSPTLLVDPLGKNAANPGYCDAWNESCGGGTTWDGDLVHSSGGGGGGGGMPSDITQGLQQYLFMVNLSIEELWLRNNFIVQRGPEGVYYSQLLAGAAAAALANEFSDSTGNEYCGKLYQDGSGTYSFQAPYAGNPTSCPHYHDTAVPVNTEYAGFYHSHPFVPGYDGQRFSGYGGDIGLAMGGENNGQPWYLATPTGRIELFDPTDLSFNHRNGCVLVGTPVPPDLARHLPYIPNCH